MLRPSPWQFLVRSGTLLKRPALCFVLVSLLDVVFTSLLLISSAHEETRFRVVEQNPVARWFLHHWGLRGMAWFKLAMVGVVLGIAHVIALKRVETARRLLDFGTILVGCVVVYQVILYVLAH